MFKYLSVVFLLALTGCIAAPKIEVASASLSAQQRHAVQARVAEAIPDSKSAEFAPVFEASRRPNGDLIICGGVKFRNRMGGMEDYTPYIASWPSGASSANVIAIGKLDSPSAVVLRTCNDYGLIL
jgi:hypothetical protein